VKSCGFQFPSNGTPEGDEQEMVNDMVACFTRRMNMEEDADAVLPVVIMVLSSTSEADSSQDTGDTPSEQDEKRTKRYSQPRLKKRKKSQGQKEKEAEARKRHLKEQRERAAGGERWTGWLYAQPSTRSASVKVGGSRHLGRAHGQHASTHTPDVLYKKFEADLGAAAETSKRTAKFRLRQRETLIRLIFRKHHHHSKREVRSLSLSLYLSLSLSLSLISLSHLSLISLSVFLFRPAVLFSPFHLSQTHCNISIDYSLLICCVHTTLKFIAAYLFITLLICFPPSFDLLFPSD